jgi:hypothetical protein
LAPVAPPPPLVSTGYESPLPPWQGRYAEDGSPVLGYEPRGKRQPRRRKEVPARAAGSSGKGWWVILLVGFLTFRACSTFNTSHRRYDPPRHPQPTPPVPIAPQDYRSPQSEEEPPPAQQDEAKETAPDERGNESTSP